MNRRTRILIGGAALLVVGVLVAWLAVSRSGPKEPVCEGRPLSEWLDGRAQMRGASPNEVESVFRSIGPEALPWLTCALEHNAGSRLARSFYTIRLRLNGQGSFISRLLPSPTPSRSDMQGFNTTQLLAMIAPGTPFETRAARAVMRTSGNYGVPWDMFESSCMVVLGRFTKSQSMVLPALIAGVTNPATAKGSIQGLHDLGPFAISAIHRMALAEAGTNGAAELALHLLNTREWEKLREEKRGL